MDICEVNLKLHYVAELLDDLWHYHQAGSHTCPCSVCAKKQSLARSIIAKALQEVTLIANCIENISNCEMKDGYPNDLTVPLKYLCKTTVPPEQSTVVKGSNPRNLRQHSSELEINCSSDTFSSNIKEQRKLSVCSDSLKDSGLNTSFSSQSLSPVLNGKYQHQHINNSQLQASDTLNEISDCDKVDQTTQIINTTDRSLTKNTQMSGSEHLCNIRSVHSPKQYIFTLQNNCPDSQEHFLNRKNLFFNSPVKSLQDQDSDLHQAKLTLSAFTPQNLMLLPFSFVQPSPGFIEELERHRRYSEQLLSSNIAAAKNNTDERYLSFSQHLHSTQETPLTSTQTVDASVYTPSILTHEENNKRSDLTKDLTVGATFDQICLEECFQKCCLALQDEKLHKPRQTTCNSASPIWKDQPLSSTIKNIDYSALVQSNCHSDMDKTGSEYLKKDCSRQLLNVQNMQFESYRKDLPQPDSFLRPSDHHGLHSVTFQTQLPGQASACKNDQILSDFCNDEHKLTSNTGSQQGYIFSVTDELLENNNMHNDSAFGSMWRPWETKDMIMGLISVEPDEGQIHCKESHDLFVDFTSKKGLFPAQNDTTKLSETTVENGRNVEVIDHSKSEKLKTDICCSELKNINSCLVMKVTEQTYKTIDQKDKGRIVNEDVALIDCSSSGNISVTQKIVKLKSQDSIIGAIDKIDEKTSMFIHSSKEQLDVSDTDSIYENKPSSTDKDVKMKFQEELPATADRSLKCLSNILCSPRQNIRSSMYQNPRTASPRLSSCSSMNHDKENENVKCSQKSENLQSPLSKIYNKEVASTEQPLVHTQHVSSYGNLPAHTIEDISNESNLVVQPCRDSTAAMLLPSQLILAKFDLVQQSAIEDRELLPLPAAINLNSVVLDDSSRTTHSSTSTPNKHLQWGTPAVSFQCSSTTKHCKKNGLEDIVQVDELKTVPISQATEQYKPASNKPVKNLVPLNKKNSLNMDTTNNQNTTFEMESSSQWDEIIKFSEVIKTEKSLQTAKKGTFVKQESRINLNQTVPACMTQEDAEKYKLKLINESYEANQSFPKPTKPQQLVPGVRKDQSVAVCGQGVVTDLHQLSPEWPSKPAPRNRRSIFGCSPPDSLRIQKFYEPDIRVKDQTGKPQSKIQPLNDLNESGLQNMWSILDASDDIGHVPSVQEMLFNCVTNSLCVVDTERNGKIISVNESFQFLIGVHEKVVGQRFCRFIKFKNSSNNLGESLPQSFILSDGRLITVKGKLAHCINDSGESIPVSVWIVPFKPQPKLTMCVIGVSLSMQAEIYLSHTGNILMYSEPFEDILGLTKEDGKVVCQIPDLNFSQINKPQHTSLQAIDGCRVPVTITLTGNNDAPLNSETLALSNEDNTIYPATISIFMNVSGLLIVGSDGIIKFCDKNYFRINLGHCHLEGKHQVSEFLSEIMKVSQSSSLSSPSSSPVVQDKLNSNSDIALVDVSRLHVGDASYARNEDVKDREFFLPQSCFSSQGLVDLYDTLTDGSDEEESQSSSTESVVEEAEKQYRLTLPTSGVVPYQTSTPCKSGEQPAQGESKEILMENGIYAALFVHGNGSHVPVTFKLNRIQTSSQALFCLWMYIQPGGYKEHADSDDDDGDSENEQKESETDCMLDEEKESEENCTCDEEDIRNRLKNLHFDQSGRTGDISLGQMLMEQAGLNQSHNATSGADMLDLEVAVEGSFGQKYMVCEALGQGSFGFVRRARLFGSTDTVVVKFIKKSKMFDDSWCADVKNKGKLMPLEVAILNETTSEHIIKLLDVHENATFVQMVMEDFGETDLFDFIDQVEIDEPLACYLFRQILWAVDYLHSKKIIHRDIKDENVIINRSFHCKLIDFGSATYMLPEGELFTKFRGTMEYCSPEVYNGAPYQGPELDAWALGVTLYTILFRENPFTATEVPGELDDLPHPVTPDVLNLMLGFLEPDPLKRFTVLQALSCDWLRQIVDLNLYSWCELFGDVPLQSKSMIEIGIDY